MRDDAAADRHEPALEGPPTFSLLVRDLVRAGLAGAIAGLIVAGIGGRVVMRVAAIAVPDASMQLTENGNRIGEITLAGSLGLILIGLLFGAFAAIVWTVVSAWIPGRGMRRALLAMPLSVALGGIFLVRGENPDFGVLGHHPIVVGTLIGLVAAVGLTLALLDDWLDGRLPPAGTESRALLFAYALLVAGGMLLLPIVLGTYLGGDSGAGPVGLALVATGIATAAWWVLRFQGLQRPTGRLIVVGRASLLAATALGTATLLPQVTEALGGG